MMHDNRRMPTKPMDRRYFYFSLNIVIFTLVYMLQITGEHDTPVTSDRSDGTQPLDELHWKDVLMLRLPDERDREGRVNPQFRPYTDQLVGVYVYIAYFVPYVLQGPIVYGGSTTTSLDDSRCLTGPDLPCREEVFWKRNALHPCSSQARHAWTSFDDGDICADEFPWMNGTASCDGVEIRHGSDACFMENALTSLCSDGGLHTGKERVQEPSDCNQLVATYVYIIQYLLSMFQGQPVPDASMAAPCEGLTLFDLPCHEGMYSKWEALQTINGGKCGDEFPVIDGTTPGHRDEGWHNLEGSPMENVMTSPYSEEEIHGGKETEQVRPNINHLVGILAYISNYLFSMFQGPIVPDVGVRTPCEGAIGNKGSDSPPPGIGGWRWKMDHVGWSVPCGPSSQPCNQFGSSSEGRPGMPVSVRSVRETLIYPIVTFSQVPSVETTLTVVSLPIDLPISVTSFVSTRMNFWQRTKLTISPRTGSLYALIYDCCILRQGLRVQLGHSDIVSMELLRRTEGPLVGDYETHHTEDLCRNIDVKVALMHRDATNGTPSKERCWLCEGSTSPFFIVVLPQTVTGRPRVTSFDTILYIDMCLFLTKTHELILFVVTHAYAKCSSDPLCVEMLYILTMSYTERRHLYILLRVIVAIQRYIYANVGSTTRAQIRGVTQKICVCVNLAIAYLSGVFLFLLQGSPDMSRLRPEGDTDAGNPTRPHPDFTQTEGRVLQDDFILVDSRPQCICDGLMSWSSLRTMDPNGRRARRWLIPGVIMSYLNSGHTSYCKGVYDIPFNYRTEYERYKDINLCMEF